MSDDNQGPSPDQQDDWRLSKFVAHALSVGRREATTLIKKGKIYVDQKIQLDPALLINTQSKVMYNNKTLQNTKYYYFLLNKAKNMPFNPPESLEPYALNVNALMKKYCPLDLTSMDYSDDHVSGLFVLTNDDELKGHIHTKKKLKCTYHIIVDRPMTQNDVDALNDTTRDECPSGWSKLNAYSQNNEIHRLELDYFGNDIDAIRTYFMWAGFKTTKIDRLTLGSMTKKDLKRGWVRPLTQKEIIYLKYF